ncbi:MAG: hypothetical protein ACLFTK_01475 [Anaerolineales bacterium]
MQNQQHQIVVPSERVNEAINDGTRKGWMLVNQEALEDGTTRLTFQPRADAGMAMQPAGKKQIDPNYAWLELLGLLGFLGVGYLFADRVEEGLVRLIGFLVFIIGGWIIVSLLSVVIIGLCLIPFMLLAQFGIPIWSALQLRKELEAQQNTIY